MASSSDYFNTMKTARDEIGIKIGTDIPGADDSLRFTADADLAVLAVIGKLLVDKGTTTDTELQTFLNNAVNGTDGSVWTSGVGGGTPPTGNPFDSFPGETFEAGSNGTDATGSNTAFTRGQTGDSLLTSAGTCRFDSSTAAVGTLSLKTITNAGWSRGLRTPTYDTAASAWYARFYFRATAAPAANGCRMLVSQFNPKPGSGLDADVFEALAVGVNTSGVPSMFDQGTGRIGSGIPNICNSAWWRLEVGFYGTTCELRGYTGANLTGLTSTFAYTAAYTGQAVNSCMIGQPGSRLTTGSWTTWHDNVAFSTTGWVGP